MCWLALGRILAPNGVQESYKTRIGGTDQWLNVRGQDKSNPIILFIHGGPASPLTPTIWQFQRPLEEYFTVVNYDQRGAGKTYGETDPASISDTIHIPRYIDDAIEIAGYVKKRYGKDKVILVGHSWGTIVGMGAALKRPDLLYAYVGVGQVISVRENERVSYDYALQQAKAHNNAEALKDNVFTLGRILPEFVEVDYSKVSSFPVPVIIFMGRHDYTTPSAPTADWLDKVKAPYKQGVWFEHSSHMVMWEEPGKLLVSLLKYVRPFGEGKEPE